MTPGNLRRVLLAVLPDGYIVLARPGTGNTVDRVAVIGSAGQPALFTVAELADLRICDVRAFVLGRCS